jgi:hypothetical protein
MRPIILSVLLLGGCATSVEGIRAEPVAQTYASAKAPLDIAKCLQEGMPRLDVELGDGFVSVSNRNQFGAILMNWLITETPTGSTIELRKTNSITGGQEMGVRCF